MLGTRVRHHDGLQIAQLETQLLELARDLRGHFLRSGIDQHDSHNRVDQHRRKARRADVISIAVNAEGLARLAGPLVGSAGERANTRQQEHGYSDLADRVPESNHPVTPYRWLFCRARQFTQTRALRNMRIQPLNSPCAGGYHEFWAVRKERSGCGMVMSTRPSRLVTAAMPSGETVGIGRIRGGDVAAVVYIAKCDLPGSQQLLLSYAIGELCPPSPCATAIGSLAPAMPANSTAGESRISTRLKRPSNCSPRLRTKRGQCSVPGTSCFSAAIIWQPLHTPSVKVSARSKKRANSSRVRAWNRMDLAQPSPAPSTSP